MDKGGLGRAIYTEGRVSRMRRNVASFPWAREVRDAVLARAERWAGYPDDRLATLVIPPQVPRGYDVHNFGCPVHGPKANEKGFYAWEFDFDRPFKIRCPAGGEEYPSNDFEAFLGSGLKDRSLLTGPYADDGWGWHRPEEGPEMPNYWFVAYYAHWSMQRLLMDAIQSLGEATVVAEDLEEAGRFAHKCNLLLWRLAAWYPDYIYNVQSREGKEHNPNYTGKLFNMIWEVLTPSVCGTAYDAVRPFLREDRELQARAGRDGAVLDDMVRDRLLREGARDILNGSYRIAGNYGMHQKSLIVLAGVLDDEVSPTRKEMIQYLVDNPAPRRANDMGFRDALENLVYRDGIPHESPGYNLHWVNELACVVEGLAVIGVNFFDDPRFRKLLRWPLDACVAGRFTPPTGDTGDMFGQARWPLEAYRKALPFVHDPQMAWAVRTSDSGRKDLFAPALEELLAGYSTAEPPPIGATSYLLPAHGMANLQSGNRDSWIASCLFYGDHPAHMHHDQLNLMVFGFENALLTDFGYPEQTDAFNHRRYGYFNNTIAHNTVVVDGVKQGRGPGRLHAYSSRGFAQVVDAGCEGAYRGRVGLYRRANIHVAVGPGQSYLFDVFYVRGGDQHDWAVHGTQADFACTADLGAAQATGTLAGPDVPYEQFYDDSGLRDRPLGSVPCSGYVGSGFQFLTNVRKAPLSGGCVCDWRLTEPIPGQPERPWRGIGLRAHLVGQQEELVVCEGPVQHYKYLPDSVTFAIRRRTGPNLSSAFVSLFEPYRDRTWVRGVRAVRLDPDDGQAVAIQADMEDGGRHYLFHSLHPDRPYALDGNIRITGQAACLVLDEKGSPRRAMLTNGTELRAGAFSLMGKGLRRSRIVSVDYAGGVIEIADPILDGDTAPGQIVRIAPEGFSETVTVRRVIDATRFSIGDEDLRVGGGPVSEVRSGDGEIVTPVASPHARIGMTVLNGRLEPIGKLAQRTGDGWSLTTDGPLTVADFPALNREEGSRFSIVAAGPGDEVLIPHVALYEWQ